MKKIYFNSNQGFTLIEALVSIIIIGVIGFIVVDLLTRTFQGDAKSQLIGAAKQNGQVALNTIDQTIRDSDAVVCPTTPNTPSSLLLVQRSNGNFVHFRMVAPVGTTSGYIAQKEYDRIDNPTLATVCTTPDISGEIPLTSMNSSTMISVLTGSFKRLSQSGSRDAVEVKFNIGQSISAGSRASEQLQTGGVPFQTTIQLGR